MEFQPRALWAALSLALPGLAMADDAYRLPDVTVTAPAVSGTLNTTRIDTDTIGADNAQDAANWLQQAPGVAVVRNGQQTGIVQLHGLYNERVKIMVDGMEITPACPNHMDPPLHYAPLDSLTQLDVIAGITPVSQGGDSIAGTVIATSAPAVFAQGPAFVPQAGVHGSYSSANDATNIGASLGTANQDTSLGYRGEQIIARNYTTPRGTVSDTGFNTTRHDLYWAHKVESGELRLDVGQHHTRDAGTPALPMDMVSDDASKAALSYRGNTALGAVEARIYSHDIDHMMDNYSLRPNSGMKMFAPATSRNIGVTLGSKIGNFKYGMEYLTNEFNAYSQALGNAASRKDMFNNSSRNRLGIYTEWQGMIAPKWKLLTGVRGDMVSMNTGDIVSGYSAVSSASQLVQTNFNALDHQRTDYNMDATLLARYHAGAAHSYEFGLARKTRSPSILERYLWSSGQSSAGQADGYNYLGNIDLKPEVSQQITAATEWKTDTWQIKPLVYYNRVTDYIQGTSTGVIIGGKPVLQYQNIDAELYGIDLTAAYRASARLSLGGTLSYVRGKNTGNGDNLYRIAPLSARLYGDYQAGKWLNRIEWNLAQRQNDVAAYNGELPTSGYGIVNLRTRWQASKAWRFAAGIENVFDKLYYDHLGGINRVANSVIAVGGQLPGMGRSAYLSVDYTW